MLSGELCELAIERYVTPMFEHNIASNYFGRREGALIIALANLGPETFEVPNEDFSNEVVLYEHTWGEADKSAEFASKALQKVFGVFKFRQDYDQVLADNPTFVADHNLIAFPGAVIRSIGQDTVTGLPISLIAGYAGLWWWHDTMIAEHTLAGIRAEVYRIQNATE